MKNRAPLANFGTKEPLFNFDIKGHKLVNPGQARVLLSLMDMQAVLGGAACHFGGPSALAELLSALWAVMAKKTGQGNWHDHFHLINDIGHAENIFYVYRALYKMGISLEDLKGFRSIDSCLTGHGESLEFPEGVLVSNGPLGSALGPAQGLAMGEFLKGSSSPRTTIAFISDGACMEGEAKEALTAIPGLSAKGRLAPFVLVVSDNNTKLSGRIDGQSFSMQPTFESLKTLGWEVIKLEDAHNLESCLSVIQEALTSAEANKKPIAIWAKTIKGKGVKALEEAASGGHGFPVSKVEDLRDFLEEVGGKSLKDQDDFIQSWHSELLNQPKKASQPSLSPRVKIQVGVAKALVEKKESGAPLFSVSSDLQGSTGLAAFQKKFPKASQDIGIAESNMISAATGLYLSGFIPVVDSFAQFTVTKGLLPLTMALQSRAGVIGIFSHTGFQDAADGASHQSLNYLSNVASLPYTNVHLLCCAQEAFDLVSQAVDELHACLKSGEMPSHHLFFLGRENFLENPEWLKKKSQLGKAQIIFESPQPQAHLVVAGSLVEQAIKAAELLKNEGLNIDVILHPCATQVDAQTIKQSLKKNSADQPLVVVLEDHQAKGGLSERVLASLSQKDICLRGRALGVQGVFGKSAYQALQLYSEHGLSAEAVSNFIKKEV